MISKYVHERSVIGHGNSIEGHYVPAFIHIIDTGDVNVHCNGYVHMHTLRAVLLRLHATCYLLIGLSSRFTDRMSVFVSIDVEVNNRHGSECVVV